VQEQAEPAPSVHALPLAFFDKARIERAALPGEIPAVGGVVGREIGEVAASSAGPAKAAVSMNQCSAGANSRTFGAPR
jgi:hypothetical protein